MDIVVAITGASGALYAQRFIHALVVAGVNVHLVVSPYGRRLLRDELGMETIDLPALAGTEPRVEAASSPLGHPESDEDVASTQTNGHRIRLYNYNDVGCELASGSFRHDGMVIVPCSSNTLGEVAHGLGANLIARAASVALKERRRLVLCHREMPPSPIDMENYVALTRAGAIVAPANPGFYLNPTTVGEIVDFVAGKLMDLVSVPHHFDTRWNPHNKRPPVSLT